MRAELRPWLAMLLFVVFCNVGSNGIVTDRALTFVAQFSDHRCVSLPSQDRHYRNYQRLVKRSYLTEPHRPASIDSSDGSAVPKLITSTNSSDISSERKEMRWVDEQSLVGRQSVDDIPNVPNNANVPNVSAESSTQLYAEITETPNTTTAGNLCFLI